MRRAYQSVNKGTMIHIRSGTMPIFVPEMTGMVLLLPQPGMR